MRCSSLPPTFNPMSEEKKTLFLLDAFALIFRAHFAFSNNPRINSKGLNTGVMFGFTNTLLEVLQKRTPSHIAVVFDTSAPTFRHEQYAEYKANRQETPEDIRIGTPIVKDIVRGFNIPVIEKDGYEADDVIGTIAKKAAREGFTVYMMTPDKDFGQLVEENILLYKPAYMGNAVDVLGVQEILDKWDISDVDQVRDMLGLQGDSSDNIPGIPGIGPKTASKLLKEFGTVEGIVENADKLKGKQRQNIEEFGEQGILSKHLATIVQDVPIEFNFDELKYSGPQEKILRPLFQDLEFRALANRVFTAGEKGKIAPANPQLSLFDNLPEKKTEDEKVEAPAQKTTINSSMGRYHLMEGQTARAELIGFLKLQKSIFIETVSDHVNPFNARLFGFAVSYYPGDAYYIPLPESEEEGKKVLAEFRDIFEDENIEITGHGIKYDLLLFYKYDIRIKGALFDTMVAHYLIDPDQGHSLAMLADQYLDYIMQEQYATLLDKSKRGPKVAGTDEKILFQLACESADVTLKLTKKLKEEYRDNPHSKLLFDLELPLIKVLATMEKSGVSIDEKALNNMSDQLAEDCRKLEDDVVKQAGTAFNLNSPRQLGEVLFDKLKLLEKPKKTKSGQYATGEEVLSKLTGHQIVADILEYRELQKLKSTYVDALPEMASPWDGKIHTNYNQAVASTGRLSSLNPNLQNIPIRTARGREVRKAFVPSGKDLVLLSADYSQIELRIMASFSEDEGMVGAFKEGKDIHAATAAKIFKVKESEVDDQMRRKAKSVNFGLIYGQSAFGLAQNLNISRTEAAEIIEAYFLEFPMVKRYMDQVVNEAREKGYVETILGRRRYLRDINSRNQTMRGFAERNAINAPIQGSAADIIKLAMIGIHDWLENSNLKTEMIMQVHDELVFEVPKEELELVRKTVDEKMSGAHKLKVPMTVDTGVGRNWLEAH